MGNRDRQQGRFCRADERRRTRLIIREAYDLEVALQEELLSHILDDSDYLGLDEPEDWFVSIADVTSMWYGTVCLCGHGPMMHDADTRVCVDPDCYVCYGYQVSTDDLLSREAGYDDSSWHFNGRPDISDRYWDSLDL